jgi:predicted nucleic acid-binding protein
MIMVDSSVWIDFLGDELTPEVDVLAAHIKDGEVLMGDLVLTEVLQGLRSDREFRVVRRSLSALDTARLVTPSLAIKSAQNYRTLRKLGITVRKTIDCLIATWCIENNVPLLHSDKDFEPFEQHLGLVVL